MRPKNTLSGLSGNGALAPNSWVRGPKDGLYRKPHMSAPMTAGTAYGRKIMSRAKRVNRVTIASSTSATASEMTICTGMSTRAKWMTNQTPCRNTGSVNAWT